MITAQQKNQFLDQGYLVVEGVLNVANDIEPFKEAYVHYLDTLGEIFLAAAPAEQRANYRERPFAERFAILLGCSGGSVLQHLDPSLSILMPEYRLRTDLPTAQRPELFYLMRNARLLDGLEDLLGREISVSPAYHLNLRLSHRHLRLAATIAAASGQNDPGGYPLWRFNVGTQTAWHRDAAYGFPDAYRSQIVTAWIPLTPSTRQNGCLQVLPGSHLSNPTEVIAPQNAKRDAVPLPVNPGDLIFFHNNLAHTALDNETEDEIRWSFNFRYLPTGEPTGRPFLPEFAARSHVSPEKELRDPVLWSEMWRAALMFVSARQRKENFAPTLAEAKAITARWQAATVNYADWLDIGASIENEQLMP